MQMLDFNAIEQPTWPIKLKDEAQTVVHLSAPTVELYDRLIAAAPRMEEAAKNKDGRTILAIYELVADILNCNDDGFTFNAEELRDKYKMTLLDVFKFVAGYLQFMQEMQEAKN